MTTERVSVTFDETGEPVVTVTINGWPDAFRFAWALAHLQCEFASLGRRIGGSLKRRLGGQQFAELSRYWTGKETYRWIRNDEELPDGD